MSSNPDHARLSIPADAWEVIDDDHDRIITTITINSVPMHLEGFRIITTPGETQVPASGEDAYEHLLTGFEFVTRTRTPNATRWYRPSPRPVVRKAVDRRRAPGGALLRAAKKCLIEAAMAMTPAFCLHLRFTCAILGA
ncbi:MAG: hypothetical protein ACYDHD_00130 [Vulcanimicrobiaceae bacterium]